jgi:type I restriction enzyme M protein
MSTTTQQLTEYLWSAADKLSGYVSSQEAIESLTSLLFLRLLSIKSEQQDDANNLYTHTHDAELIIFPSEARWQAIQNSLYPCEAIRRAVDIVNSLNSGILENFLTHNRTQHLWGDTNFCHLLVDIVSNFNLNDTSLEAISIISDQLISAFAESRGVQGGEFFTPRDITNLLVELANPQPNDSVYDPACGTGGFLLAACSYARQKSKIKGNINILGRDVNNQTATIARVNAILHGLPTNSIRSGNSLLESLEDDVNNFDIVLTNPPIGLRHDDTTLERLAHSHYSDFKYGPPTRIADLNFIQHALSRLNNQGRAVILTGLRPLFITGQEGDIRRRLIDSDIIEAVITLPSNTLPHTGAQSAILIFNKSKPDSRQGKILFIHAENEFEQTIKNRRVISENGLRKIVHVFRTGTIHRKFSALAMLHEIASNDYILIPAQYVGLDEVDVFLGSDVQFVELNQIATVLPGTKLGQLKEGATPVIQGRDLTVPFLSVDDLTKKDIPQNLTKLSFSQAGDILIQRIGQTPRALLVEENLAGVLVSDTVYIVRPNQNDWLRGRYLVEFLNSNAGQAKLSAYIRGAVIPTLSIAKFRNLKVPIPNQSIMELIRDLQDVEKTLSSRVEKTRSLRSQLFSIDNPDRFNQQLRSLSVEAQVLKQSVIQSDDINFQIRNYFPHVISFAYRSLDAIQNEAQLYKEQLRVAENILAFLGSIGLALAIGTHIIQELDPKSFTYQMLRDYWQGGISPGDWQDLASRVGAILRTNEQYAAVNSYTNLWFKGRGSKQSQFGRLIQNLVNRKNDFKHDRGPQTDYEYTEAVRVLGQDLKSCLQEMAFFVQHPIRLVQDADIDWRSNKSILSTLVYVGDHPGLRQEKITLGSPLPKDKLYLELKDELLLPLYPLISANYCTSCKTRETYFIDRWESSDGRTILKSFERGHTHNNNEVARQIGVDMEYWLQNSLAVLSTV